MNIVHIAPDSPYSEGWAYQENLLPKYQARLNNNVTLIVNKETNGKEKIVTNFHDYISPDGFRVIRLDKIVPKSKLGRAFFSKLDIYNYLIELKPDMVFFHALISVTIDQVIKYKKEVNKNLVIVMDNHFDNKIGLDKTKKVTFALQKIVYRYRVKRIKKYIDKVYGVTPWRKEYAEKFFGVPSEITDTLFMGADDDKLDFDNREKIRAGIRKKYNVKNDELLIVTGGKIDKNKKIDLLLNSCKNFKNVKIMIFGKILDDVKDVITKEMESRQNIINIGWIDSEKVYDYFFAADLACFPGQHSVLWEQACASKVPCLFEWANGMDYLNINKNVEFIKEISEDKLKATIKELIFTEKYYRLKRNAENIKNNKFLYSEIAKKSLECLNK